MRFSGGTVALTFLPYQRLGSCLAVSPITCMHRARFRVNATVPFGGLREVVLKRDGYCCRSAMRPASASGAWWCITAGRESRCCT